MFIIKVNFLLVLDTWNGVLEAGDSQEPLREIIQMK